MSARRYVFAMTRPQAEALLDLGVSLGRWIKRSPLDRALTILDESLASQDSEWERCPTCKGSGWVEDES
jgi:hypothetical protein